ncbi:MAG TPA: FAD-binding oxidoreductase [Planctomycetes bacterium]|nr:FAD-binding oxidoreductase [Planctomycetota bacterium]HIN81186.1 FAD-binding oxidoreductase [Planctomycetota bacterium]
MGVEVKMEKGWVVGGGVVGLSVARELALRGVEVGLLEAGRIGGGASGAATGLLARPPVGRSAWMELRRSSWEIYPGFLAALAKEGGEAVPMLRCGALHLHREPPTNPGKLLGRWLDGGHRARWVGPAEIRKVICGYVGDAELALEVEEEGFVDPRSLLSALKAACLALGVAIEEDCGEVRFEAARGGGTTLRVGERRAEGIGNGTVAVVAAGWQSAMATVGLPPARLPLAPVQGEAIALSIPSPPLRIIRFEDDAGIGWQLAPTPDGTTWFGSIVSAEGTHGGRSEEGLDKLLRAARCLLPDVSRSDVVRHWAGVRPKAMRRGGPLLCRWPTLTGLWIATGHYRSGIICAPQSARLLVGAILDGEEVPASFDWDAGTRGG